MVNLNKYNLKKGDTAILDEGFNNRSIVNIVEINEVYATVKSIDGETWDTMVSRLTPMPEIKRNTPKI